MAPSALGRGADIWVRGRSGPGRVSTPAGARSAWGPWPRICGAGAGRWRVGGGRSARRLTGPRGSVRWKRGCARSAGGTEVGTRDDLLQHRCDSQELLELVRPDGWPYVLEHDPPQARDIVFLVARGGECRQQAGGTDQRRHLAGARAAHERATHQALAVRPHVLHLLEFLAIEGHPQRHENSADALLGFSGFDFEIGRDLMDEIHEGLEYVVRRYDATPYDAALASNAQRSVVPS